MEYFFDTRNEACEAAAERIGELLRARLEAQSSASIIVSGGSSPRHMLRTLSSTPLDWHKVHVVPSDERWVPPTHEDSNERMIRESLLQGNAASARLLSVFEHDVSPEERCETLDTDLRSLPIPFACSLLGMGEDAHFASLFPELPDLNMALDSESGVLCVPVRMRGSQYARVSLTMTTLTRSDEIILLFFGDAKLTVYEQAKAESNGFPVSRLLRQKRAPVRAYWAP